MYADSAESERSLGTAQGKLLALYHLKMLN